MPLSLPAAFEASAWVMVMVAMMAELKLNRYREGLDGIKIHDPRDERPDLLYLSLFFSRQ